MVVTRRVYLYAIAFVALWMLVAGLAGLLDVLVQTLAEALAGEPLAVGPDPRRNQVSLSSALTAIGLVAWLVHWGLAERLARRRGPEGAAERGAALRKLYLYAAACVSAVLAAVAASGFLTNLCAALFGALGWQSLLAGPRAQPFALALVAAVAWAYHARVAARDRAVRPETGAAATLRRWYTYLLCAFGLFLGLFAAVGLLQTLWEAVVVPPAAVAVGRDWLARAVAAHLGPLMAGLVLWVSIWRWSNAWFARDAESLDERRAVLRKVYLYLVLAVTIAWSVWNSGRILYEALRAALVPERLAGWGGVVHDLGGPAAAVLGFGLVWAYHGQVVQREAALAGERGRQRVIRWLYGYLVALIGLLTLAVGLSGTLATLLDLLVQPTAARETYWWQERVSLFATLVVVGLPLWTAYWRRLQREAAEPLARESVVRRIYLFLVFGLAVLTLLCAGAFALYQTLRRLLGELGSPGSTSDLLAAASAAAIAALFLVYHLRVFRTAPAAGDAEEPAAPAPESLAPESPALAVAVLRATDAAALRAYAHALQAQAPAGIAVQVVAADLPTVQRLLAASAGS